MITSIDKNNVSLGGIEVRNYQQIESTQVCQICQLVLLHPCQLLCCGVRLCRWCSKKGLSNNQPFVCPFCHAQQMKKQNQADRGVARELNTVLVDCYVCDWNGMYRDYLEHLRMEHPVLKCEDCEECFVAKNSLEEHREEQCEYRSVSCDLLGCGEVVLWSNAKAHYSSMKHQHILLEFFRQSLSSKYTSSQIKHEQLVEFQELVNTLVPIIEMLAGDWTRLKLEHDESKNKTEQLCSESQAIVKMSNDTDESLRSLVQLEESTSKNLVNTKKSSSCFQTFLLDNGGMIIFPFTLQPDSINSSFFLASPIFNTAPFGYSFVLNAFSTINEENHNERYLSVSIELLCSEYDAILPFPFTYNLFLSLLDQSGQRKHQSVMLSSSDCEVLIRPTSEKNSTINLIKFCPLSYLTAESSIYFRENRFYLQFFVDFLNARSFPFG
ncbi:unnamed protein product [Adineta ricciae]|uniref:TRAF1-6 MATH domain-containing protein n=1 Tax=Adineta ricciae TaxID=249248 RepID=A0A814IXL5_ADIRI|nr:unnamed protein product [Adineta ricciae]CAF1197391.1 unnamed protein product [Adineta ricciae]